MYRSCLPEKIMRALTENELGYAPQIDEYVIFTNASHKDIEMAKVAQTEHVDAEKKDDSDIDIDGI